MASDTGGGIEMDKLETDLEILFLLILSLAGSSYITITILTLLVRACLGGGLSLI